MRGSTAALLVLLLALGCSGGHRTRGDHGSAGQRVTVKGSDTMIVLAQRWAERYMETHEGSAIEVSGGGSGTGIAALLNGTADIANTSRPLSDRERAELADAVETRVALDAIAIYVHEESPIRTLTLEQLRAIFRGHVTRWSEVGGPDRPIVLYSRENSSGTYSYFKEHVLDGSDFALSAQTLPGTAAVINAVSQDPNGIGYGGIGYAIGARTVPLAGDDGEAVAPTLENALSGRYPLARHLWMVTRGVPDGAAGDLIAWARSPEGQELVEAAGFYPLSPGALGPE